MTPDSSTASRVSRSSLHFALTVFISAFLLFQVQPLISKYILPWFGGSPAVWTTCLLFFQTVLFAGYTYAHLSEHYLAPRWRGLVHLGLIAAALVTLPIAPGDSWKPADSLNPTGRILLLLTACIGLPYFVLSSTGPLVQAWFSREYPDRSPYRLYALSNIGSLLALLSYPFVVEPALDVTTQSFWWSIGFVLFCALYGYATIRASRVPSLSISAAQSGSGVLDERPSAGRWLLWLAYPGLASLMLLATTNHVCQDVAVIPFLWVVPLSLYLISFIITFDHPRWYARLPYAIVTLVAIYFAAGLNNVEAWKSYHWFSTMRANMGGPEFNEEDLGDFFFNYREQLAVHFVALFALCMLCHGELVRIRPAPRYLTSFYLMISLGGALGGLFVSLLAPWLFTTHFEWKIGIFAGFLLAGSVFLASFASGIERFRNMPARILLMAVGVGVGSLAVWEMIRLIEPAKEDNLLRERTRNFYGVISVEERKIDEPFRHNSALYNGRILHGMQFLHPEQRHWATTYYAPRSGVGHTLSYYRDKWRMRVGAVGLGVGTLATYADESHTIRFYDINPEVIRLAEIYFSYLNDARQRGATVEIVPGDARLSLERDLEQKMTPLDVLVLDAFSGDAIPNHLLTREAFEIYIPLMAKDGAIAIHVSNRYLNLALVVYALAEEFDWKTVRINSASAYQTGVESANWIILSRNEELLAKLRQVGVTLEQERENKDFPTKLPLWTDQRHNLFEILE